MSLFDTLKYPINDPPTEEQLRALPRDLYRQWSSELYRDSSDGVRLRTWSFHPGFISRLIISVPKSMRDEYVTKLRDRIQNL